MVVRLAESLGLSLRERNALLLAAGFAPIFPESGLDDEALRPVREALERILEGHLPYPAVIVRPYGELVLANTAVAVLTAGAAPELLEPPINVLRLAVHPDGMGSPVENLAEWGRHIVGNLRAHAAFSPRSAARRVCGRTRRLPAGGIDRRQRPRLRRPAAAANGRG